MSFANIRRSLYALRAKGTFEKSKMKGTYDGECDPPKEKHVQTILWTLQGQNVETSPEQAFSSLSQRLMASSWVIVLKTEIILHRAIEQVGPGYSTRLADLNIPMQNFNDPSEKGSAHNKVIQDYFTYIRSKAQNHSRRNSAMLSPPTERARFFERLDDSELLRETGYLLTQLGYLVKLGPSCEQSIRNYHMKVTQNAAALVLKDSNPLYRSLAIAMDLVVERFFEMETKFAEIALEQYKKFESCTRMLAKFFEMASYLPYQGISPPTFVQRPREFLLSMNSFLNEADDTAKVETTKVAAKLKMSEAEIEAHCKALEDYERESKMRTEEEAKQLELISEPVETPSSPPTQPLPQQVQPQFPQPNKADLIMSAFSQPTTTAPGPMMTGGMNPMMNMMQQFMTMSMMGANPYITGMMNPMMMTAPQPQMMASQPQMMVSQPQMMVSQPQMMVSQPQVRSNLDFSSSAYGASSQRLSNPYQSSNDPFGGSTARGSNPFETASSPFDTGAQKRNVYDAFGNPVSQPQQKAKDPFADLL